MHMLKSWLYGAKETSKKENESVEKKIETDTPNILATDKSEASIDKVASGVVVDSKVADYFKDFPEPYRRKAIERFSRRTGLYKWDFFRDHAMLAEVESAKRGIFLEDRREYAKEIEEEQNLKQKKYAEEKQRQQEERIIPEWEKKLMTVIPLQKGDTMGKKLFFTANFVLFGASFLWHGIVFKRRNPYPRWRVFSVMTGCIGICCCSQVAAYYKLMDLGIFDRSKDDRQPFEKYMEEAREDLDTLIKYLESKGSKP